MLTTSPKIPQTASGELHQLKVVRDEPHLKPTLPPDVAACLGERLRAHYAQLMNEPIPGDLLRILEALDQTRRAGSEH